MIILLETPAGFALFKINNQKKLDKIDNIYEYLTEPQNAHSLLTLLSFSKFKDTHDALKATSRLIQGKIPKKLQKFLETNVISQEVQEKMAVSDKYLGKAITEKLGIDCIQNSKTEELFRGLRLQLTNLLEGLTEQELKNMTLGLAHGLSRYKLKFSSEKVDTMIIQAISLLDDLDKEINNYMMRLREWYGWHFPELSKIVTDNLIYAKVVKAIGMRHKTSSTALDEIVPEDIETDIKQAAEISMGTEINEQDEGFILQLSDQVIELTEYRAQLNEYLMNRMRAVAPNLSTLVGELVGARLIAHAGSLMNLAKYPASTVQILGAEKALFKAIRTKHNTPKYGLLFQTSMIGQTPSKLKGKMSRTLAAKCALCIRFDALGECQDAEFGEQSKEFLEKRLAQLEAGSNFRDTAQVGQGKASLGRPFNKNYQAEGDFVRTGGEQGKQWIQKNFSRGQLPDEGPQKKIKRM